MSDVGLTGIAALDAEMRDRLRAKDSENAALRLENAALRDSERRLREQLDRANDQFIEDMAASVDEIKATERQKETFKASLRFALAFARRKAAHRKLALARSPISNPHAPTKNIPPIEKATP